MPELAPPGAGLPKPELFIAKIRFALKRWRTSDQQAIEAFRRAHQQILTEVRGYSEEQRAEQVLIKRLRGLEDSSRNWSIYMTLEHMRIVNAAVADFCEMLSNGEVPPGTVSTADVKPSTDTGPEVVDAFDQSCLRYLNVVDSIENFATPAKYPHPWFGPMDASGWVQLMPFHTNLHLSQIQRIASGLST